MYGTAEIRSLADEARPGWHRVVLALALAVNRRNDPRIWDGWTRADRWVHDRKLASMTRLRGVALDDALADAEVAGLVRLDVRDDGRRLVNLRRAGVDLLGLDARHHRRSLPASVLESLDDLPHADLLRAVASFVSATPAVERVAAVAGRDVDSAWDDLGHAESLGLVQRWADHPTAPAVVLSPAVAARLLLRLSDDGSRYVEASSPDRQATIEPMTLCGGHRVSIAANFRQADQDAPGILDDWADDGAAEAPDVLSAVEQAAALIARHRSKADPANRLRELARIEAATGKLGPDDRREFLAVEPVEELAQRLPRPRHLLGSQVQWGGPYPAKNQDGECRGCSGKPLGVLGYCIVCDRWGFDMRAVELAYEVSQADQVLDAVADAPAPAGLSERLARFWSKPTESSPDPKPSRKRTRKTRDLAASSFGRSFLANGPAVGPLKGGLGR